MYQVLIVDDEYDERALIRFLLKDFYQTVCISEAANGQDAIKIINSEHIDILLTDVQMPFVDGIQLAKYAKKTCPDIEILFFSGYDDFVYVQNALSVQAVNYILKPINQDEFYNSFTEILSKLDSSIIHYTKSDTYIENAFYQDIARDYDASPQPSLEDHQLLLVLRDAISTQNEIKIKNTIESFIQKYHSAFTVSHIYIRYIYTSILQELFTCIPDLSQEEFNDTFKLIYSLKHLTDITQLLENYCKRACEHLAASAERNFATTQVIQYINEHYNEDISLNELAELVFLSPNYLSNIFAKDMGITINRYIRQIRMNQAYRYLTQTNMKISEISRQVGYPNTSYFCKLFQEQFDTSPEKYRQTKH